MSETEPLAASSASSASTPIRASNVVVGVTGFATVTCFVTGVDVRLPVSFAVNVTV